MRAILFLMCACAPLLFAQEQDDLIEDVAASADQETPLPADWTADSLFEQAGTPPGSRPRVRFITSLAWNRHAESSFDWPDMWARTKLTSQFGATTRSELLFVRRVDDPHTVDEIHLAVSGSHEQSEIRYALGTFQHDWGLGILNSASFGAARRFAYIANTVAIPGIGIVPRTTSREESWLRGVALSRTYQSVSLSVWGSNRDWNGDDTAQPARLTGVLSTTTPSTLERRDNIEENSAGGSIQWTRRATQIGLLTQTSEFVPEISGAGRRLLSASLAGATSVGSARAMAEFARSGEHSAWSTILSYGTRRLRSAFYAMYAAPDYFASRSQSPFSFGEEFRNSRIYGLRMGVKAGRHDIALDTRVNRSPGATPTAAPYRKSEELLINWYYRAAPHVELKNKAVFTIRDLGNGQERFGRSFRFEPVWRQAAVWSLRAELRNTDYLHEPSANGQYLHLQVARDRGKLKPGFRVAFYNLDELDDPLLVYEPTTDGAYPLETLTGNGTRVAGWCRAAFGKWKIIAKAAQQKPEAEKSSLEFAIGIGYHQ